MFIDPMAGTGTWIEEEPMCLPIVFVVRFENHTPVNNSILLVCFDSKVWEKLTIINGYAITKNSYWSQTILNITILVSNKTFMFKVVVPMGKVEHSIYDITRTGIPLSDHHYIWLTIPYNKTSKVLSNG